MQKKKAWNKQNLLGLKFNKLKVIATAESINQKAAWLCECECGNTKIIEGRSLKSGNTKTCGYCKRIAHNRKGCGEIGGTYWSRISHGAKQRNKKVLLTVEDAWSLFLKQNRKCAISGVELNFVSNYNRNADGQSASLDRIDHLKDYTIDNVQWVHKEVNLMKHCLSDDRLLEWCKIICENKKLI